jgi:hypothetical protein
MVALKRAIAESDAVIFSFDSAMSVSADLSLSVVERT